MVSVIAPEVPELIKKQDHTPVQSREKRAMNRGGRRGGCSLDSAL